MKVLVTIKFGPLECVKGLDFPPGEHPERIEIDIPKEESRRNMDLIATSVRKDSIIDGSVPVYDIVALRPKEKAHETRDPQAGA